MQQETQTLLSADSTILAFIGSMLILLLGISGYFINKWITASDSRELVMQEVLTNLNDTLAEVNTNLRVYQASMDGTLHGIRDKAERNSACIDIHDKHLQDHEIRLTIIEKQK